MDPHHHPVPPARSTQSQHLAPDPPFISIDSFHLFPFLFRAAFDVFKIPRRPSSLPTFDDKLVTVLLERRHCVQRILVVGRDVERGPRYHHGRDGLVGLDEVFVERVRDRDQMRLEVFGAVDEDGRVDDGCQGAG